MGIEGFSSEAVEGLPASRRLIPRALSLGKELHIVLAQRGERVRLRAKGDDCPVLFDRCDGLQITKGAGRQDNKYRHVLSGDGHEVNYGDVLLRPKVESALREAARKPDSRLLRRRAINEILHREFLRPRDRMFEMSAGREESDPKPWKENPDGPSAGVVMNKCRGVQIGSRCSQKNTFNYEVRGSVISGQALVNVNRKVAAALVDHLVDHDAEKKSDRLDKEQRNALLSSQALAELEDARRVGRYSLEKREFTAYDGVSVSDSPHVRVTGKSEVVMDKDFGLTPGIVTSRRTSRRTRKISRVRAAESRAVTDPAAESRPVRDLYAKDLYAKDLYAKNSPTAPAADRRVPGTRAGRVASPFDPGRG